MAPRHTASPSTGTVRQYPSASGHGHVLLRVAALLERLDAPLRPTPGGDEGPAARASSETDGRTLVE